MSVATEDGPRQAAGRISWQVKRTLILGSGLALLMAATGCSGDDDGGGEPMFPEDYAATYVEVRDCRSSADHDLNKIRVLADPAAAAVYLDRTGEFPVGSILVKEEYDFADESCSEGEANRMDNIKQWSVMVRLPTDSSPETLDWSWQEVDRGRSVRSENSARCINCHDGCDPPEGFMNTCTVEDPGG